MERTIKHGRNAYVNNRCRCEQCHQAALEYKRRYNARKGKTRRLLDSQPFLDRIEKDGRISWICESTIRRWRRGKIDLWVADRWAITLGYHPLEIWGQDFYVGVEEMDNNYE